ncbi:MAG TPA: hypothetical protein VGK67_06580 [Myxococcales bacterium]
MEDPNASAPQTASTSAANPIPSPIPTPPHRTWPIAAGVAAALFLAALVWALMLRSQLGEANQALEAHLKTIVLQTQQVEALDRLAVRIDRFNREFGASLGKLQMGSNLEADLKAMGDKPHVPEEAKKTLEEFEQSVAAIDSMAAKVKEYERYLGTPMAVQKGDTHSQLAKRYLLEEAKLSAAEADQVLRRTALAWELEPGNAVYNLFHEGLLLSTVTQGTAKRPPLMVQVAQRQAVQGRIQELEEKVRQLEARLASGGAAAPAAAAPAPETGEGAAQ